MRVNRTSAAQGEEKRARGRPLLKDKKREDLLRGATALFNSRGISAISVAEIAKELQLARASVYHYVKDRADLVYLCYKQSSDQIADDLLEAAQAENGLARLQRFIDLAMTPERPPLAVLSEIHALDESIAAVVRQAHERNLKSLRKFIKMGIEDNSIRPCDDEVIAQSIFGMLSWAQLLPEWSDAARGIRLRERTGASMVSLLTHGLATENAPPFHCDFDVQSFQLVIDDVFNRAQSSELKIDRVLANASYIFNRKGIAAASLDEIADHMGVTKGVLYHYFQDKEDLIIRCYDRAFAFQNKAIVHAETNSDNGLDAALINAHLNIQAKAGPVSPLMPQPGFGALPEQTRRRFQKIAGRQNRSVANFLAQGEKEGLARSCDAALVTHICAGAFGWIPKWRSPDDSRSPIDIADEICALIDRGLQPTG